MQAVWRPRRMAMARWIRCIIPVSNLGSRHLGSLVTDNPTAAAAVAGSGSETGKRSGGEDEDWQAQYRNMYYKSLVFQEAVECTLKLRPMRILHDPHQEALFMPHFISIRNVDHSHWLREVLHPCYRDVCMREGVIDPEHDDPLKWPGRPLTQLLIKALQKTGSISAAVPGTIYHPSFGVVLSETRARVNPDTTLIFTGVDVFSVPIAAAKYGALEYLECGEFDDELKMDVAINQEKFLAGASSRGVCDADAALSYLQDMRRGIRPGVLLHRFSICKENLYWFISMQLAVELRSLYKLGKLPSELPVLLRKLGLPEKEILDTCTEPLTYRVLLPRSLVIELIPADGGYHAKHSPAVAREAKRHKGSDLIILNYHSPLPDDESPPPQSLYDDSAGSVDSSPSATQFLEDHSRGHTSPRSLPSTVIPVRQPRRDFQSLAPQAEDFQSLAPQAQAPPVLEFWRCTEPLCAGLPLPLRCGHPVCRLDDLVSLANRAAIRAGLGRILNRTDGVGKQLAKLRYDCQFAEFVSKMESKVGLPAGINTWDILDIVRQQRHGNPSVYETTLGRYVGDLPPKDRMVSNGIPLIKTVEWKPYLQLVNGDEIPVVVTLAIVLAYGGEEVLIVGNEETGEVCRKEFWYNR